MPRTISELQFANDRRLATVGLICLTVPTIWFVRSDFALFAGNSAILSVRLILRLAGLVNLLAGLALIRSAKTREAYSRRLFVVALLMAVALPAVAALRPAGTVLPIRVPVYFITVMYAGLPNTRWRQNGPPLVLALGMMLIEFVRFNVPEADLAGDFAIFVFLNCVGLLVVDRRLRLEKELEVSWQKEQTARAAAESALAELRSLRGIIPICGHCKRVRTELGDWQQIEQYVRDHSEADFSHGICPVCLKAHYPEADAPAEPRR